MNLMGYDAAALGNHEFNYGLQHLDRAIELAGFPFVSANIFRHDTAEHAYTPWVIIPVATHAGDTVRVGVTGNTPPGVHLWDRDHVTGVLEFREIIGAVRAAVADMRRAGADVVVVLSHGGLDGTSYDMATTGLPPENVAAELARREPGIDVIFLGHTHREVADTTINGVLLTQARQWAGSLAVATLALQRSGGAWRVARKGAEVLRPGPGAVDRAFMDSLRWEHERTVAWVNARIGTAPEALPAGDARVRDTPIIDFINDVQRRASGAQLSATAAFQLSAGLPAGDITVAHVAALYPYENTLKAIRITGEQLRAYLEKSAEYYAGWPAADGGTVTNFRVPGYNFDIVSGVDYTIDISRPVGQRITALAYQGRPVTPDQSFTMAINSYRQSGGGGYDMIAGAPVVYDQGEDVRDLLIEEVQRRAWSARQAISARAGTWCPPPPPRPRSASSSRERRRPPPPRRSGNGSASWPPTTSTAASSHPRRRGREAGPSPAQRRSPRTSAWSARALPARRSCWMAATSCRARRSRT
jgi:2',3'-cyclic-nucleotide 2'-phosphodiesterase (5'-nucleotidase family)